MAQRIVILGGGTGGALVANRLRRQFGSKASITVVDRDDRHVYRTASSPRSRGSSRSAGAPAPSTLPSGQSESGYYSFTESYIKEGSSADVGVSFPTRLGAPLLEGQVIYLRPGNTRSHCTGPGHADPGFLCIYSQSAGGVELENVVDNEPPGKAGSGVFGFEISLALTGATGSAAEDRGIWTVTAA